MLCFQLQLTIYSSLKVTVILEGGEGGGGVKNPAKYLLYTNCKGDEQPTKILNQQMVEMSRMVDHFSGLGICSFAL